MATHARWCGKPLHDDQDGDGIGWHDGNRYCTPFCVPGDRSEWAPGSKEMSATDFLSLLSKLPPNVRRFRAGDFEVELDGPPRAAKVPTAEQAAAAHEAAKPRPPSDIDSLTLPGPRVFVEDEADA